jgi:hypothetical protein
MPAYDDAPECDTDECPHFEAGTCNHYCTGSTCDGPSILPQAKTERTDTANRSESEDTMSDNKHTPGPWRVGDAGTTVFGPPTGNPAPRTIGYITRHATEGATDRANARLMAAAPDILAALEDVETFITDGTWDPHDASMQLAQVRAAIAKAEGR